MRNDPASAGEPEHRRWVILAALVLARTAMGFQFQTIASTAPFLRRDLGIGYAEIGTLIGLYMLPGVAIALPGGLLGRRFGDRTVCAGGLALMILGGALVGASQGYPLAVAGRLTSGVGAVLFSLVITKMVTDWFSGREIVTAMGAMLASWPFGIALALVSQGALARALGWPAVMFLAAGFCTAALALVVGFYRPPPAAPVRAASSAPAPALSLPRREALPTAVAGLIWGLFNVGFVLFFSFAPPLLVEHGRPPVEAGALVSLGLWISMPALPLGGYLAERLGRPDGAVAVCCAALAAVLALLTVLPLPALPCALLGLLIGPPAGAIMALPARALTAANRAVGLGLFYTCYYAAMAAGPALAGVLRDAWSTAAAALLFGAALFLTILPLLALFHRLREPERPQAGRGLTR
jgi:predicted MFS family arabinose efflux permease